MTLLAAKHVFPCPLRYGICPIADETALLWYHKTALQSCQHPVDNLAVNLIDKTILNTPVMKRAFLGEFEEVVLLTVAGLGEQAYGVTITQTLEEKAGRVVGFSSVHTTLQRLSEKGYLTSHMGGATAERGGRRKRFFSLTALGQQVILEVRRVREQLWNAIPPQTWQLTGG